MPDFNTFFTDPIDSFITKYKTKVYEPALRQYRRENSGTFDNQYDLRAERRSQPENPAIGLPTEEALMGQVALANYIFGQPNPLSEEEQQRLDSLSDRNERLQPADFGVLGGARIQGNPYSIDTRRLMTGLGDLAEGFINDERGERRDEFEDELTGLKGRKKSNQQIAQNRTALLKELLPKSFERAAEEAVNVREHKRDVKADTTLEELRQQGREELENLRAKNNRVLEKIQNKRVSGGGPSVTMMREYVEGVTAEQNLIWEKLQNLYDIQGDPVAKRMYNASLESPEQRLGQQISDLEEQYLKINQEKADMIMAMGQIPGTPGAGSSEQGGSDAPLQTEDGTITISGLQAYMDKWDISEGEAREALTGQGFKIAGGQ